MEIFGFKSEIIWKPAIVNAKKWARVFTDDSYLECMFDVGVEYIVQP